MRALLRPIFAVLGVIGLVVGLIGLGGAAGSVGQAAPNCATNAANASVPVCATASVVAVGQTAKLWVNGSYWDTYQSSGAPVFVIAGVALNGQPCGQPLSTYLSNCTVPMAVAYTNSQTYSAPPGSLVSGNFTATGTLALPLAGNYSVTFALIWQGWIHIYFAWIGIPQAAQIGTPHPFALPATLPEKAGCSSSGCPTVYAEYSFTMSGLTGTFSDGSHFTNGAKLYGVPGWNFGDGSLATGVDVSHTFGAPGNYTVTETVTASQPGSNPTLTSVAKRTVYATTAPPPTNGCASSGSCTNGSSGGANLPTRGSTSPFPFLTLPLSASLVIGFGILAGLQIAPAPISGRLWNLILAAVVLLGTYAGLGGSF